MNRAPRTAGNDWRSMMNRFRRRGGYAGPLGVTCGVVVVAVALLAGCGSGNEDRLEARPPKEEAGRLEKAFASASERQRSDASVAAAAMKTGDFEKAVVSLGAVKGGGSLSLEQGLAVHASVLSLEEQLVRGADAGDERAKRAYELLRAMKRK